MRRSRTYIVAVSGGVDSVALLDMLVEKDWRLETADCKPFQTSVLSPQSSFVIAHFDHGIRPDSTEVGVVVGELAQRYGLPYELGQAKLGSDASEATARQVRYNFLRQCCKKYQALGIITAHHQDDLIETALLNLLRGTNWRGLTPMINSKFHEFPIYRPLLNTPKRALVAYAKQNTLSWHEDPTNSDQKYLRNYIRHTLLPKLEIKDPEFREQMLMHIQHTTLLKKEIATLLQNLNDSLVTVSTRGLSLPRHHLIMLPSSVALEVLYSVLLQLDPYWHPSSLQLRRILHFVKVGQLGKVLQISGRLEASLEQRFVQFQNRDEYATLA